MVHFTLLPLLGYLLIVSNLLGGDNFAYLVERILLDTRFGNHIFHFNQAWKC